jgi:alpha-ribazole phosphatase|tara:strand:+ start:343 stop:981 length:639 start_codon:yes stop_codon:yes gene_type:complete
MTKMTSQAEFTCIDFLRHGECEGGEIFRGSGSDVALTNKGWQQMRDSVQDMACWDSIITSPLQRCRRFASEQSGRLAIPLAENTNWREIHFGEWEGKLMADIWKESPDLVASYFKDPSQSTPHNGEPFTEVAERLKIAWEALLTEHRNKHVLVVQHGGTIRILLALILGMPATAMNQFEVPFACLSRIKVFHHSDYTDFPMLVSHNTGSSVK